MANLNQDTNNYDAASIKVLEGLEAVRTRPGMYIGSVSTRGLNHLIYEIVDNSVDEHLAGFCSTIKVTLEADGRITGALNGAWQCDEDGAFRCELDGTAYTGIMTEALDSKENVWVTCFTALDQTGAALWGSHAAHEN